MNNIAGIPYTTAEFDAFGKALNQPQIADDATDVIVVSHGWNNTRVDAEELYTKLFTNFVEVTKDRAEIKGLKFSLVGIIWPSHKFDELMSEPPGTAKSAGGAASLDDEGDSEDAQAAMHQAIDKVSPLFDSPEQKATLAKLHGLVPQLEESTSAQSEFVVTLRQLLGGEAANADQIHPEDASDVLFEGNPQNIFNNVKLPAPASNAGPASADQPTDSQTGAGPVTGGAAGFSDIFSKAANAVVSLMNHATYFQMKKLAGTVGKEGVAPLIDRLTAGKLHRKIHLAGHSFGGRVVTATAAASKTKQLRSMSLLQAAYSHNGLSASKEGYFRSVIDDHRVAGATIITYSKHDRAVGLAYPAASRINGDKASAFGKADDDFGGMGSSGAQNMEPGEVATTATELLAVGASYALQTGKIHNLNADQYIIDPQGEDAHGFVFVPEVAWAISQAMLV